MAFIDEVQLNISAGNGGDGVVRWRHEKFKPKAGPGGGNGGSGGDVYVQGIDDLSYLEYYRYTKKFQAEHGESGGKLGKEGANGKDLLLRFPRGTILSNTENGDTFEIANTEDKILILKGGRGGLGNEHFKSSTNTTPYEWTPGTLGEAAIFDVELRLFADAGFVGLPSAGKSTLLNTLTNANSKVGAYHFTTLEPHLGAMGTYILADIPGLIVGASQGKGLGHKFLRHISRTEVLVHVISLEDEDVVEHYQEIRKELEDYDKELMNKKEVIVLSKEDMVDEEMLQDVKEQLKEVVGDTEILSYSAYDDESIKLLKKNLMKILEGHTR